MCSRKVLPQLMLLGNVLCLTYSDSPDIGFDRNITQHGRSPDVQQKHCTSCGKLVIPLWPWFAGVLISAAQTPPAQAIDTVQNSTRGCAQDRLVLGQNSMHSLCQSSSSPSTVYCCVAKSNNPSYQCRDMAEPFAMYCLWRDLQFVRELMPIGVAPCLQQQQDNFDGGCLQVVTQAKQKMSPVWYHSVPRVQDMA